MIFNLLKTTTLSFVWKCSLRLGDICVSCTGDKSFIDKIIYSLVEHFPLTIKNKICVNDRRQPAITWRIMYTYYYLLYPG